jgi:CopG family nickel-responsive transcriptional regulator
MSGIARFSVSVDHDLLATFDSFCRDRGYPTRSKAVADLIRQALLQERWAKGRVVTGVITIAYDHHKRELVAGLLRLQHDATCDVLSSLHIHLDHQHCLEVIVAKGKAKDVQELADALKGAKGVLHADFSVAGVGA